MDQSAKEENIFYFWRRKYKEARGPGEKGFLPVEIGPPVSLQLNKYLNFQVITGSGLNTKVL